MTTVSSRLPDIIAIGPPFVKRPSAVVGGLWAERDEDKLAGSGGQALPTLRVVETDS